MPVFSYLAFPTQGNKLALQHALKRLAHCEVAPADNKDVLILVTDTPDEQTEQDLQRKLNRIECLQSLNMTFGHLDN